MYAVPDPVNRTCNCRANPSAARHSVVPNFSAREVIPVFKKVTAVVITCRLPAGSQGNKASTCPTRLKIAPSPVDPTALTQHLNAYTSRQ